ncbi:MAG: SusC/RagA family TonB-linked outer membrane protein [Chitinophagaceae bacterium]|nr:SusC/RagA family TonB-linked outer membrane protein [Chitinophagaceae bacterium]
MKKIYFLMTMSLLLSVAAWSQAVKITGQVKNVQGEPVPFATVTVKGTSDAVSADQAGNFSISAARGSTLVITAASFQTQEVSVGNQDNIPIVLVGESNLQEVVVTALGIRRTEKALGYSVSKVDPDNIVQKSEPDMLKGLQGKVAGVDIRTSQGTPGAATRIQIRGNNSFYGNSQPLIVVDGIPYSNDQLTTSSQTSGGTAYSSGIANLDPNDIATMNVLKGSSAAAIYGSRGSNGVVIITTKSGSALKGKKGLEVNAKSSVSFESIANLPDYQNEYGAGSQQGYSNSNGSWGPAFRDLDSIPAWNLYKVAYPDLFPSDNIAYRAYPDNVKDLFRTGMVYENSVGFQGGDAKSSVSATLSNLSHTGYVEGSSYKRQNIGLGAQTKLDMGLTVRGNFSYAHSNQTGGYFGENQVDGAASLFARSLFLARNWDLNLPFEDENGFSLTPNGGNQFDNPRWSAKYNVANTAEERFVAGVHFDYNINKWIRLDYNLGSNVSRVNRREVTEVGSRAAQGLGRLILDNYRKQEIESNFLVTLTPSINEDFSLRAIVGHNFNQRTTNNDTEEGNKFIVRGIHTLKNTAFQSFPYDYYEKRRIIGAFADVTVGFRDYAFINMTARNDWSSTLPAENRSYFYPSVSGSFVFSDALNLQGNVFDYGKIRAGWAKVGRDADPYQLQNIFLVNPNFLGNSTVSRDQTFNNPNLKPEFTQEIEIGTQLSFLKRLVELDFTVYKRNSTNQIAAIQVPASSGYNYKVLNFGEIENKGIEIDLAVRPVRTKSFNWEIRGIFTKNTNTVVSLTEGVDRIPLANILDDISPYLEPGKPFGYLRGLTTLRAPDGQLLISPETGGMIISDEESEIGNPNPDYKMGVTNTFTYKGFILSALFDMTKGGDIYSVTVQSLLGRGVTKDTRDREGAYIISGVYGDATTGEPILVGGKTVPNTTRLTANDLWFSPNTTVGNTFAINTAAEWTVYDATVYRLREVTLGYEFPKSLFSKLPIGSVTLSFTGRNLWFLAPNMPKYTNFDPEVNSFGSTSTQGIELSAAPTTKRYGINLAVTF